MVALHTHQCPTLIPSAHPADHQQFGDRSHKLCCLLAPNPYISWSELFLCHSNAFSPLWGQAREIMPPWVILNWYTPMSLPLHGAASRSANTASWRAHSTTQAQVHMVTSDSSAHLHWLPPFPGSVPHSPNEASSDHLHFDCWHSESLPGVCFWENPN